MLHSIVQVFQQQIFGRGDDRDEVECIQAAGGGEIGAVIQGQFLKGNSVLFQIDPGFQVDIFHRHILIGRGAYFMVIKADEPGGV